MKNLFAVFLVILSIDASADIPDLECSVEYEAEHDNNTRKLRIKKTTMSLRAEDQKLYIESAGRGQEYFYGEISQLDYLRYSAGNKTLIFKNSNFTSAIVIHSDLISTRIADVLCKYQDE